MPIAFTADKAAVGKANAIAECYQYGAFPSANEAYREFAIALRSGNILCARKAAAWLREYCWAGGRGPAHDPNPYCTPLNCGNYWNDVARSLENAAIYPSEPNQQS